MAQSGVPFFTPRMVPVDVSSRVTFLINNAQSAHSYGNSPMVLNIPEQFSPFCQNLNSVHNLE